MEKMTRREFLGKLLRGGVLTLLLSGGIGLALKKPSGSLKESCINSFICRNCRVVPDCTLPQALSYRAASQKGAPKNG